MSTSSATGRGKKRSRAQANEEEAGTSGTTVAKAVKNNKLMSTSLKRNTGGMTSRIPDSQDFTRSPYKSLETWDSERLRKKMADEGYQKLAKKFKDEKINGQLLPLITDDKLKELGVRTMGKRLTIKKFLDDIMQETVADYGKVFNDPIHGHIELHPLCVRIIDTPEFQRLRYIKQLGNCYVVYPGASHNRFEHSIGVCYLAGQLVRTLQKRQPSLNITDKDVLCVEVAGLCHDLGHGPFSHLFDKEFIPLIRPDVDWKHEVASEGMFNYMLKQNNLTDVFLEYDLSEDDITFITEQVITRKPPAASEPWPYKGRRENKGFLYEIVANKRNGIDVDKWDYFARDCHMLGIKNNFDHNRCIQFARVIEDDGAKQICFRDKEVDNLYGMFHTRQTLHRQAYQHRVTNIVDIMVAEAMQLANDHILFLGKNKEKVKMSEAIEDMKAFSQMTDNVFFQILYSTERHQDLKEARKILKRILHRRLYKCVGQTQLKPENLTKKGEETTAKEEILDKVDPDEFENSPLEKKDVILHVVYLDYGMKDKNPIDQVRFYSKDNPDVAKKGKVSNMLPKNFAEKQLRIYYKKTDERSVAIVKKAFTDWCNEKDLPPP